VSNIRVFGSVARGEEREDSDVDLLVTLESGHSLVDFCGFRLDVSDAIGHTVDLVDADAVHPWLKARISAEAVSL
jgi:predicted nucleotidyltransferase